MRKCKVCKQVKPLEEFSKRSDQRNRRYECKSCIAEWARGYRARNKDKIRYQKASNTYGITINEAEKLYSKTHCDICGNKFSKTGHIDHCHTTNEVRGVLCTQCNMGIGYLQDDIEIMKSAIKYLSK